MGSPVFEFGDFQLDTRTAVLLQGGHPVPLTHKAYETLVVLLELRDRVADKAELMERLWPEQAVEEGNLTQQISTLRKALGDTPAGNHFILTVPRRGYRFVAEVWVGEGGNTLEARRQAEPRRRLRWRIVAGVATGLLVAASIYLSRSGGRARTVPRAMLAVLPFENMSPDDADDYIADGFTEELTTVLAGLDPDHLGVIARTSVMPYKGKPKPVRDVARELKVGYVLEGSVRRDGTRLRIAAQLIDTRNETHLLADVYEQELNDIFRVEEGIAEKIGERLSLRLLSRTSATASATPSPEAHVAYLKGLHFWNKRDEEGVRSAIELFREAVDLDPAYARAHAGLAAAYVSLATSADAIGAREARSLAQDSAQRALGLNPRLAEGFAALAAVSCRFDWNWADCDRQLSRALELDPNYATGWHWRGEFMVERGRFAEGQADLQKARTLDPLSPAIHANLGIAYMYGGQYEEALACFADALELDPKFLLAHRAQGLTLLRRGRAEDGIASLREARALDPRSAHAAADLGYALARAGRLEEARALRRELDGLNRSRPVSPYDYAVLEAGLRNHAAVLGWLRKAYDERATGVRWLKVEPIFDVVRNDAEFEELLRKIALPD